MVTNTKENIYKYIEVHAEVTAKEIIGNFNFTPALIFRHLKDLLAQKRIEKLGTPPKVFYRISAAKDSFVESSLKLGKDVFDYIENNYVYVSGAGDLHEGKAGFDYWCAKNQLDFGKTALEYFETAKKYDKYKADGLIDGLNKLHQTFPQVFLNQLYYLDFYSLERFGKTKLGAYLLYAKQSQNRALIEKITGLAREKLVKLIADKKIDAVGFIPPTVERKIQFQKEFERLLGLSLPRINIVKAKNQLVIPQKSLNKLDDRIENARNTIFIDDKNIYENILLIDDAVGSGATFNETAKKIKDKGLCRGQLIGLALTGSFKGFDTISEI